MTLNIFAVDWEFIGWVAVDEVIYTQVRKCSMQTGVCSPYSRQRSPSGTSSMPAARSTLEEFGRANP